MKFNSDFCTVIGGYPLGAVLQSNDGKKAYVSAIENNTGDFNSNPELIGTDWILYGGGGGETVRFVVAEGSSDIITATYSNPVTELKDGMIVCFQSTAANVTTTPSFNPNGLGAVTIVKGANQPLSEGDISGAGYLAILQYSANYAKWVLQNPATGIASQSTMPVGSVYVQFSGQTDPTTLFGGTWDNISSTYAGLFFRAEGGDAATFGETQTGGVPNVIGAIESVTIRATGSGTQSGALSKINEDIAYSGMGATVLTGINTIGFDASQSSATYGAAEEVRPANSTIRIWKRTA